jgi:hypothetical protein
MNAAIANLEKTIDTETAAARAALKVALQHAANVGRAYSAVRDCSRKAKFKHGLPALLALIATQS